MSPNPPDATHPTLTRHLRITGRVQGVGYRWHMTEEAQRLGLTGWVRNRRDGSVEAMAQGPAWAVQTLIDWAQHGPSGARVDGVVASEAEGAFEGFGPRETV